MKVYYAHCLEIYGKEQEKRDIATLKALGFEVINPSEPVHVEGYRREGMNYFTQLIENQADALAFRATASGLIPAGVAKEIEAARRKYVFKGNELISLAFRSSRYQPVFFGARYLWMKPKNTCEMSASDENLVLRKEKSMLEVMGLLGGLRDFRCANCSSRLQRRQRCFHTTAHKLVGVSRSNPNALVPSHQERL